MKGRIHGVNGRAHVPGDRKVVWVEWKGPNGD